MEADLRAELQKKMGRHHLALLIACAHCEQQPPYSQQTYWVGVVSSLGTSIFRNLLLAEVSEE